MPFANTLSACESKLDVIFLLFRSLKALDRGKTRDFIGGYTHFCFEIPIQSQFLGDYTD
jgi:hypothetical protein